jgi:hypothetical protein
MQDESRRASSAARRRQETKQQTKDAREKFARAMARAEFGRFYWNDELDSQLRKALQRRPARPAR